MTSTAWPWPAPADDGAANHLICGLQVPQVSLPATLGSSFDLAAIAEPLILFVYPWTGRPGLPNPPGWDDIPGAHGSTPEAEGFRDAYPAYRRAGYALAGLSLQLPGEQLEFAGRTALPYPLLSDTDRTFSGPLCLPVFEIGGQTYLKRLTMIITRGRIERILYPVHPPHTHAAELLAQLA